VAAVATDAAAVATDAAAVDAAAATHLVATVAVASTGAAVAEALEDVAGAASGGEAAAAVYRGARASSARPHGRPPQQAILECHFWNGTAISCVTKRKNASTKSSPLQTLSSR
jgi:hypothetical protein